MFIAPGEFAFRPRDGSATLVSDVVAVSWEMVSTKDGAHAGGGVDVRAMSGSHESHGRHAMLTEPFDVFAATNVTTNANHIGCNSLRLDGRPIDIAGGASAVRQALQARCLNELVLDIVPVVLRDGERMFDDVPEFHVEAVEAATSPLATHIVYKIT